MNSRWISAPQAVFHRDLQRCSPYLIGLLMLVGCRPAPPTIQAPPPPTVTVSHPIERELIDYDRYSGRVEPTSFVEIRARVSGYLDTIQFKDGSLVKQGDILFTIDPRPYQAELDRAQGDLTRLQARVDRLTKDLERFRNLVKTNVITEQEFEKTAGDKAEAVGELAASKAAVERAKLELSFTTVTAPLAGRVGRHLVSQGNLVSAGGAAGAGTLLTTIVSVDPMHVYCDCSEQNMLKYQQLAREGKRKTARDADTRVPMFIGLANEIASTHEGYIDFVDNRVDPKTGTIRARGVFENQGDYLTPGLFVRIRVPGSGRYRALLIPERAIAAELSNRYVLTVNAKEEVEPRTVQLGTLHGDLRVIASGLSETDRIIVNALSRVRPGMVVKPQLQAIAWKEEGPLPEMTPATPPGAASQPAVDNPAIDPATEDSNP